MLGDLCFVIDEAGGWKESFIMDVEGFSPVPLSSGTFSAIASIGCSAGDGGAGTKNFAFAVAAGFTDGIGGDWNDFAGLALPWLKVSTYLSKNH